jgi:hypothetical protein
MLTDETLTVIAANRKKMSAWPWVTFLCCIFWPITARISPWLALLWPMIAIILVLLLREKDIKRRTLCIEYPGADAPDSSFSLSIPGFKKLASSSKIWRVISSSTVTDRKHNAGAGQHIVRSGAKAGFGLPPFISSNIKVPFLRGSRTMYFFPDAILIHDVKGYARISYDQLHTTATITRFIESGFRPREAPVVDQTWQIVNKNGGPDRRAKNNRQIPVVQYDVLRIRCDNVVNDELYISAPGAATAFVASIGFLKQLPESKQAIQQSDAV